MRKATSTVREIFLRWWTEEGIQMGAALAYYAVLSLGPMLLLLMSVVGFLLGEQAVHGTLLTGMREHLGDELASSLEVLLAATFRPAAGAVASVVGSVSLILVASGVFSQLRFSLNKIFKRKKPQQSVIRIYLRRRISGVLMVLALGTLLVCLVAADTAISALSFRQREFHLPTELLYLFSFFMTIASLTCVLVLVFRFLPDIKLRWRSLLIGATASSFLLNVAILFLGVILGNATRMSIYGATGSIFLIMLSSYFAAHLIFLGAHISRFCEDSIEAVV